jgi:hypothetical protein
MKTIKFPLRYPRDDALIDAGLKLLAAAMRWRLDGLIFHAPEETYIVDDVYVRDPEPGWPGERECQLCHQVKDCCGMEASLLPVISGDGYSEFFICDSCILRHMDQKVLKELLFGVSIEE